MRKVWLDDLPKKKGYDGNKTDWKKSVGYVLRFEYDDMYGEFKIVKYDIKSHHLTIVYNNFEYIMTTDQLNLCKISAIFSNQTKLHKFKVGDIIEVECGKIKIIKQLIKRRNGKALKFAYTHECLNCNRVKTTYEYSIVNNTTCRICSGGTSKLGITDMWTTNPKLAKLLANHEDGYKYKMSSHTKVDWKCPDCGEIIKDKTISNINTNGLSCPKCSDGLSYPEKFMYNFLKQLKLELVYQYNPSWIKPKKYDFYFKFDNREFIVETDGGFHGKNNEMNGMSAEDNIKVDKYKDDMASQFNIEMIRIDTIKSDIEYIKKNIINSQLSAIFDLSNIDWFQCHEFACSSLIKRACELWNSGIKNTTLIGKQMNMARTTICKYLKQGTIIGWCNYSVVQSREDTKSKILENQKRKVICITTNTTFDSILEASEFYNISDHSIGANCKGKYKYAGRHPDTGECLIWMYLDDYTLDKANEIIINFNNKYHVVQLDLNDNYIKKYYSVTQAVEMTGITNIIKCCQGTYKSSGGFKWMYLEDYSKMISVNT